MSVKREKEFSVVAEMTEMIWCGMRQSIRNENDGLTTILLWHLPTCSLTVNSLLDTWSRNCYRFTY